MTRNEPTKRARTGRLWILNRRQTGILVVAAILTGTAIGILARDNADTSRPSTSPASVERVSPGTAGTSEAVWVFGSETLRFDPQLRDPQQVALRAFGAVQGAPGRVYFYSPGSGRVGVLDAARNTLGTLAQLPPGSTTVDAFVPIVAVTEDALWLVPAPGQVARLAHGIGSPPVSTRLPMSGAPIGGSTGVVAGPSGVLVVTESAANVDIARLDPTSGAMDTSVSLARTTETGSLAGIALDDRRLWVLAGTELLEIDPVALTLLQRHSVPRPLGRPQGLVVAGRDLWTLSNAGATLTRFRPSAERFGASIAILDQVPGKLELPASLVADGRRVWAMVSPGNAGGRALRVVGLDTRRGRLRVVDVPRRVLPGALAISSELPSPPLQIPEPIADPPAPTVRSRDNYYYNM